VAGESTGIVKNCYATGKVEGTRGIGGVVGVNRGLLTDCYATGNVSGTSGNAGGVVGSNSGTESIVENCYATGNVRGDDCVGGVAGYNAGIVESCYASGVVSGNKNVGGVLGEAYSGNILRNCYATGNVSGTENVGGVAGYGTGTLESCYASGVVSGDKNVGGVAGYGSGSGCVALNPNINSMGTPYGRIGSTSSTKPNNYARRDMKHNNSTAEWFNSTGVWISPFRGHDGVDIIPADYHLQSWWSSRAGFDLSATGAWEWHTASRLPVLKGFGQQNPEVSSFAPVETTFVVSGTAFEMVWIHGGYFKMGSPTSELNRDSGETLHPVILTNGFYMGKYEVTQAQYKMVMGTTITAQQALAGGGSTNFGRGNNYPMYYVSWNDALVFCNKLSMLEGLSPAYSIGGSTDPAEWGGVPAGSNVTWNSVQIVPGSNGYRLPTEAQWEYSCRAGTTEAFNWGTDNINITQANYNGQINRTSVVGSYAPNAWGLHDMHGNVAEWCWDRDNPFNGWEDTVVTNPMGQSTGSLRVFRGGNWSDAGRYLRSAALNGTFPGLRHDGKGFRIIRPQ
jgi:formylglycine-generating enzyme required for sulfatase activity